MSSSRSDDRGSVIPVDLVVVLAYVSLFGLLYATNSLGEPGDPVRVGLFLPLLFLLPGYALTAAAFPRAPLPSERRDDSYPLDRIKNSGGGIDDVERVALGFGLSLALSPLIGLVLAAVPGPFQAGNVIAALIAFTALLTVVAAIRRWRIPGAKRYRSPMAIRLRGADGIDTILNVVLALTVLLATATGAFALATPNDGSSFTNLAVGQTEDGEFVAEDGPGVVSPGEPFQMTFRVENQEDREVNYEMVVQVQRIDEDGNIVERARLQNFSATVPNNHVWTQQHTVRPLLEGDRLQVVYLLYLGDAPEVATRDNADQYVYIWFRTEGGASATMTAPEGQ